ncbi:MAG: DUF805 domain-containing protein [Neisseriaceae bacterium]
MFIFHPFRYGIASKKEFWITALGLLLFVVLSVCFLAFFVEAPIRNLAIRAGMGSDAANIIGSIPMVLISSYAMILRVSIEVRRLHDAGYSGWWVVLLHVFLVALQVVLAHSLHHSQEHMIPLSGFAILGVLPTKLTNNPYREKALSRSKDEFKALKV